MRTMLKAFLVASAALAFVPAAHADEDSIKLKPGDNLDVVEQNCAACHSLDYIQMNSAFLDQKGWQAEVAKMVNALKAPISEADQKAIADYLSAHYAKP